MRTLLRIIVVVVVLSLELYAVYAVLHPRVSPEYRAYYIDHTTRDWHVPRYAATPEEGIAFGKEGWPSFVDSAEGFSTPEDWGRWTDAELVPRAKIAMNQQFSGPLCLEFAAHPAGPEIGQKLAVALGPNVREVALSQPNYAVYHVSFDRAQPSHTLEFRLSKIPPPNSEIFRGSPDGRRLGIALFWLKILPGTCNETPGQ